MINFKVVSIQKETDYEELQKAIPPCLQDKEVLDFFKKYIGLRCDTLLIEYPYYDSDYLSTYYKHYALKFKKYEKRCCRVHLQKDNNYYGYITLRPTIPGTKIGKTYIIPELLVDSDAYLMLGTFQAHIRGQIKAIRCFPWKRQQTDISACAHTAAWTVIRYFGNKYKNYADTTIGEIVDKIANDWGRETPSRGLNPVQLSDLLKKYGFSPFIMRNKKTGNGKDSDELIAYIESGLPMISILSPQDHAVSIIGHGNINYDRLDKLDDPTVRSQLVDSEAGVIPHSRLIDSIYVMDDRFFPYVEVPIRLPNKDSDVGYGVNEFSYTVVPLYNRMQLSYSQVFNRMITWLKSGEMNWETLSVSRIYITSSNSLKRNAMESDTMNPELVEVILQLSLPRFVWCVDLAGVENYKNHLTSGRIIVDTTAATWEEEPWILRHDMERIEYKDYDEQSEDIIYKKIEIKPYRIYENNLVHIGKEETDG